MLDKSTHNAEDGDMSEEAIQSHDVPRGGWFSNQMTHLTEPVKLKMGQHWEMIRFVVVPKMTEAVILGLAWLDK